jgi:hypothetical protein
MKLERSIIRRRADHPEIAEGDRTLLEIDPDQLRRMFEAGEGFLQELSRLLAPGAPPRRRTSRRKKR